MKSETSAPLFVSGATFVREHGGIHEYTLDQNGLQVLLAPDPRTLVAGVMVTYHVGSRNEAIGYTGATHLLEHLMFKGSEHFNKENKSTVWDLLETKGALVNATTWNDRTNYFEVVPTEHVPTALALEADRMRNARIREQDRISEMTVVRNEFERGENIPIEAVDKQLWALAYEAHPYHHSTIGWRSDIENVPIERLQKFYNDFYWPDNATLSVVGGFNEAETLRTIIAEFGKHMKAPQSYPGLYTTEPKQEGERRALVKRAGEANMVGIGYKIPEATHPDLPALVMLSLILGDGKTSRLYRALVDAALVTDVSINCSQFHDPGLFTAYATLAPKIGHAMVEKIIKNEYQKVAKTGIKAVELLRAKRAIRAYLASRRDGPYALLSSLNEEIAIGDWTRFVTFPKELETVRAIEVQNVAKKYFLEDQSVTVSFIGIS